MNRVETVTDIEHTVFRNGTHGSSSVYRYHPSQGSSLLDREEAKWLLVYVGATYNEVPVDAKTKRWTLRVTPAQDMIVRQVVSATGMSLSEYVVSRAVEAAVEDLADRRVFAASEEAWEELVEVLERPATAKPKIAALLANDSVLDSE